MATTWLRFNNAMKAQGLKREEFLPYRSWAQPYAAWFALIISTTILILSGYTLFYPGRWSTVDFIFQCECQKTVINHRRMTDFRLIYTTDGMVFICIAIVLFWKVFKRTKFLRGHEVDLTSDLQDINDYTEEVRSRLLNRILIMSSRFFPSLVPRAGSRRSTDLLDKAWRQGLLSMCEDLQMQALVISMHTFSTVCWNLSFSECQGAK